jgi:hypothetical protein
MNQEYLGFLSNDLQNLEVFKYVYHLKKLTYIL